MNRFTPILYLILLALNSFSLPGQAFNTTAVNQRVALVIGNADYDAGPLLNPGNDARAMATALRETGFEVLEYLDMPDQAEMKKVIREFGRKIQNGGVGLFYYAGHGIQVNGKNYLIPTKAQIYAEEEVEYESVDVGFVLAQMEIARNRMNIIILDACRNNPFARSWRSSATGLAFINAPTGTLIAYSTAPGSVASDGTGVNGLYTGELLRQIGREGLKIEDVFKNVRSEVLKRSNNMQTPWESSSLVGDFYFIRGETEVPETVIPETTIPDAGEENDTQVMVESSDRAEWKITGGKYFFYLNGSDITGGTVATNVDKDVLLFDNSTRRSFLLKDYWNINDEGLRKADELHSESDAFWRVNDEKMFWFYIEGKDVTQEMNAAPYGKDWIVYHEEGGKYYVMNNYETALPGKLYHARDVFSPNKTLWWADPEYYYFYVEGEQIASRTWSSWKGNDLLVHYPEAASSYLFRDYYNHTDRSLRPAEILCAPGLITCTRDEQDRYYLFKDNQPYDMKGPVVYSGRDLLVYDTVFQQTILFEKYLDTPVSTHIMAKPVYSRSRAVWRRQDNIFYLYVEGVLQTGEMVSSGYAVNGSDLEIFQKATGITYILPDYANRNDNVLRPAEFKQ